MSVFSLGPAMKRGRRRLIRFCGGGGVSMMIDSFTGREKREKFSSPKEMMVEIALIHARCFFVGGPCHVVVGPRVFSTALTMDGRAG